MVVSTLLVMEKKKCPLSWGSMKEGTTTYCPLFSDSSSTRSLSKV